MGFLDLTLGASLIGVGVSTFLFGLTTGQVYAYANGSFKDGIYMKLFVLVIWMAELGETVFIWVYLYQAVITNYGKPETIDSLPWSLGGLLAFSAFIECSIQAFYAYRIRVLSDRLWVAVIVWIASAIRFGAITGEAILAIRTQFISVFLKKYKWFFIFSLSEGVALDIVNTASLCFYLIPRKPPFANTRKVVNKIILWSIETGILTCICAIGMVVLSVVKPSKLTGIWFLLVFVYPKLFSLSLMVSLNARRKLQHASVSTDVDRYLSGIWSQDVESRLVFRTPVASTTEIEMLTQYSAKFPTTGQQEVDIR